MPYSHLQTKRTFNVSFFHSAAEIWMPSQVWTNSGYPPLPGLIQVPLSSQKIQGSLNAPMKGLLFSTFSPSQKERRSIPPPSPALIQPLSVKSGSKIQWEPHVSFTPIYSQLAQTWFRTIFLEEAACPGRRERSQCVLGRTTGLPSGFSKRGTPGIVFWAKEEEQMSKCPPDFGQPQDRCSQRCEGAASALWHPVGGSSSWQ